MWGSEHRQEGRGRLVRVMSELLQVSRHGVTTLMNHPSDVSSRGHLLPVHERGGSCASAQHLPRHFTSWGEPPHSEVSSDHNCPYASPGHTTVGSGLGRLGRGNALSWLS